MLSRRLVALLHPALLLSVGATANNQTALGPKCDYALQVLFLQDISASYHDDLPQIKQLYPKLMESISKSHPESQFKVATFTDLPIPPMGVHAYGDHCFKDVSNWSSNITEIGQSLERIRLGWGVDLPEASLLALRHVAAAKKFPAESFTPSGRPIARMLLTSTDAAFHTAHLVEKFTEAEYKNGCRAAKYLQKQAGMDPEKKDVCPLKYDAVRVVPFRSASELLCGYDRATGQYNGVFEDYPEANDLQPLKDENINLVVLLGQSEVHPERIHKQWKGLVDDYKKIGGVASLNKLKLDSSDLLGRWDEALAQLSPAMCKYTEEKKEKSEQNTRFIITGAAAGAVGLLGAVAAASYFLSSPKTIPPMDPEDIMEMADGHSRFDRETELTTEDDLYFN